MGSSTHNTPMVSRSASSGIEPTSLANLPPPNRPAPAMVPTAKKSIMKKPSSSNSSNLPPVAPVVPPGILGHHPNMNTECQYAELLFEGSRHGFASDDSVLYIHHQSPKYHNNYATIDHSRRHSSSSKNSSKFGGNRSSKGGLMHSASCPFKVNFGYFTESRKKKEIILCNL